jgi:hypothetical protein
VSLLRRFASVERRDAYGWINFPDRDAAQSFVDAGATLFMGGRLPPREGPVRVRRAPTILVAEKA